MAVKNKSALFILFDILLQKNVSKIIESGFLLLVLAFHVNQTHGLGVVIVVHNSLSHIINVRYL